MGVCSVSGNSVLTFDGMIYAFQVESCSLTLLQDQVGSFSADGTALRTLPGQCVFSLE